MGADAFNFVGSPEKNYFLYPFEGALTIDNKELHSRSGLCFAGEVTISTMDNCRFLLIGGNPINEPIVQHGPFVMNTKEEILKAMEDYQSGSLAR